MTKQIDPCTLVLFGATGNLARVKLYPGLYRLDLLGRLPENMKIMGVGRRQIDYNVWIDGIRDMVHKKFKGNVDEAVLERFIARNVYQGNAPDDADAFKKMKSVLADESVFPQNFAYFLSVRPVDFAPVVESLAQEGLTQEDNYWRRVVVEKPFGTDLASAKELQASLTKNLKENQIYRIDHRVL